MGQTPGSIYTFPYKGVVLYAKHMDTLILTSELWSYLLNFGMGTIVICRWEMCKTLGTIDALPMECVMLDNNIGYGVMKYDEKAY